MHIQLTKDRKVGSGHAPYIIAELGSNHNGDMEISKKLIKAAKQTRAASVKYQS